MDPPQRYYQETQKDLQFRDPCYHLYLHKTRWSLTKNPSRAPNTSPNQVGNCEEVLPYIYKLSHASSQSNVSSTPTRDSSNTVDTTQSKGVSAPTDPGTQSKPLMISHAKTGPTVSLNKQKQILGEDKQKTRAVGTSHLLSILGLT